MEIIKRSTRVRSLYEKDVHRRLPCTIAITLIFCVDNLSTKSNFVISISSRWIELVKLLNSFYTMRVTSPRQGNNGPSFYLLFRRPRFSITPYINIHEETTYTFTLGFIRDVYKKGWGKKEKKNWKGIKVILTCFKI